MNVVNNYYGLLYRNELLTVRCDDHPSIPVYEFSLNTEYPIYETDNFEDAYRAISMNPSWCNSSRDWPLHVSYIDMKDVKIVKVKEEISRELKEIEYKKLEDLGRDLYNTYGHWIEDTYYTAKLMKGQLLTKDSYTEGEIVSIGGRLFKIEIINDLDSKESIKNSYPNSFVLLVNELTANELIYEDKQSS